MLTFFSLNRLKGGPLVGTHILACDRSSTLIAAVRNRLALCRVGLFSSWLLCVCASSRGLPRSMRGSKVLRPHWSTRMSHDTAGATITKSQRTHWPWRAGVSRRHALVRAAGAGADSRRRGVERSARGSALAQMPQNELRINLGRALGSLPRI